MQGTVALRVPPGPSTPSPPPPGPARWTPLTGHGYCLHHHSTPRGPGPQGSRSASPGQAGRPGDGSQEDEQGCAASPVRGTGADRGAHLAPRTPPDATQAKIHTNIYSVPASGWGRGAQGPGEAAGLYTQPLGRVGLWQEDRVQRLMGPGGVRKARPWGGDRGAGLVPRGHGVQVGSGRPVPTRLAQARLDSRSWWLPRGQLVGSRPPNFSPSPAPNREGSTRVLLLQAGKRQLCESSSLNYK